MGRSPQFNRRFPTEHHDLIGRIIDRLRADPAFADGVEDLLSRPTTSITTPLEQRRDAVLEEIRRVGDDYLRQFARMRAELRQHMGDAPGQQGVHSAEELQDEAKRGRGEPPVPNPYIIITPRGQTQITDEGKAEIVRQLNLGIHHIAVAQSIGVGDKCIREWKKRLAAKQAPNPNATED